MSTCLILCGLIMNFTGTILLATSIKAVEGIQVFTRGNDEEFKREIIAGLVKWKSIFGLIINTVGIGLQIIAVLLNSFS